MGGKKKAKANKLARMSEEEKLRYLQQRAAAEEEAKRRKEQLLAVFVKNKLKHEDAFSRLNSAKINQHWRQTLRQIKNTELQEAAETLHQTFDIAVQTKNKIIATLLEDLGNSVAMHSLAVQTQLEFINKIIGISEERLDNLHTGYEQCRKEKLKEMEKQAARSYSTFAEDKDRVQLDMFWQNQHHQANSVRIDTLAQDYRNDYKYEALSEIKQEEEKGSKIINLLQAEIKQTLKNYHKSLSPFIDHYKQLKDSDAKEMDKHKKNIKTIHAVESKLKKTKHIQMLSNKYLKKIETKFTSNFHHEKIKLDTLREKVKKDQYLSELAVKHLSMKTGTVTKKLETFQNLLSFTAKAKQSIEKYLTEKEMYCTPDWKKDIIGIKNPENKNMQDQKDTTVIFWKLYSEIKNEVIKISGYKASLMDENSSLQHSLTKCMNTLAKPSSLTSCIYRDIR